MPRAAAVDTLHSDEGSRSFPRGARTRGAGHSPRGSRTRGSRTLEVGIGLALVCAVATQLGFLCKHRGAAGAPEVRVEHPLRSARALFASRWFAIGMAIAAAAWLLHVAALAIAPLSTVQAVLSTGVVLLAVMGDRIFGHAVSSRQWLGVAMTATG